MKWWPLPPGCGASTDELDMSEWLTYKSIQKSVVNSPGFSPTPFSYLEAISFPSIVRTESVTKQ